MKDDKISRRKFLPLFGGAALLPLMGLAKTTKNETKINNPKILLRADGSSVQVDESVLKEAKVVKNNMSNKALLNWLKPKSKA
jgi:hypothetical protein